MKKTHILFALLFAASMTQAQHKLEKIWETDSSLLVPESVLFDGDHKVLYVANIDGPPWEKDGKGSVGKVGLDGKIMQTNWVSGLHAPKGMAKVKNSLYVADVDAVVVIDIKQSKIVNRIIVDGAQGLNDVSADTKGVIWVTDSKLKKLHRIENGKPETYVEGLKGPNGILAHQNELYILDAGGMYRIEKDKTMTKIADGMEGGTDGIEHVSGMDFIVSAWAGTVWYIDGKGNKEVLLDTRDRKINSADIGYDAQKRILYVPTFFKNSVVAYKLN
jgi:DNA-binding beta-propeller fold protein YncE